ncbi:hypothetical protein HS1genome_2288 [Sulfodiicoccus acidiphilus]|nr:hypothetical protein HS1genome_2288 [Sulfodiicoccus acidiphilus]
MFVEALEESLYSSVSLVSASELESELSALKEQIKALKEVMERQQGDLSGSKATLEKLESMVLQLERELSWRAVAKSQGLWKSRRCKHVNSGICGAWHVSEPEKLGVPQDAVEITDGAKRVSVIKFPDLCIACPLYEPRRE